MSFPRRLKEIERTLLFGILPPAKPGYNSYRTLIGQAVVLGPGRFGRGNIILGKEGDIVDTDIPSAPVFATGVAETDKSDIDIIIHEENYEQIEVDISPSHQTEIHDNLTIKRFISYSDWIPGMKSPFDSSEVREIIVKKNRLTLAIAISQNKLWLHEHETGVNHLIPVTNFYNELMGVKKIRDPETALKPALFFSSHQNYSDTDIVQALIAYQKYMHKLKIETDLSPDTITKKRKSFSGFFRRK